MEICHKAEDEELKIDTQEVNTPATENLVDEKRVLHEENVKCLNEAVKPVSPKADVLQESHTETNSIEKFQNKMKKKRKKSNIEPDLLEEKYVLAEKKDASPNSKSDPVLSSGDDLCIRDFEVEISSFNLSKPVLLNLDTYSIEPSIATIENVVSLAPGLSEPTENLEVSLDPDLFFPELIEDVQVVDLVEDSSESDASPPKEEVAEVSLLTSSDEDDVILQEPYIETIEVSDACSDDEPLAKLLNLQLPTRKGKRLKMKFKQYTCHVCTFWTYSRTQYNKHLSTHDWYFCTKCDFTCGTESKLSRHYRTHIFNFLLDRKCRRSRTADANNVESRKVKRVSSKNKKPGKRRKNSRAKCNPRTPSVEL